MKIALILSTLVLFISCNGQKKNSIDTNVIKMNTINVSDTDSHENESKIDLTDTTYFNAVKDYIKTIGTIRKVYASSLATQELNVTYYEVYIDSMKISVDHTDRIYMSLNNRHFGNVIKENNIISPEVNYGVPNKNPKLTKEKELKVLEFYQKIIIQAMSN